MKHIFIVNKISGKGSGYELIPSIEDVCKSNNLDYEIKVTEYVGHAKELAQSIKAKDVCVYAVGGDGTLLEVVNGLNKKIPLGVIPAGSGNDFYRYFYGVCKDLKANILNTIKAEPTKVDIGRNDKMLFLNTTSLGTDASINANAQTINRKTILPIKIAYILSIIKNIIIINAPEMKIVADGQNYDGKYYVVAVMNGKYYGNGVKASPNSEITDGYLDLVLFKNCPRIKAYMTLGQYLKGNHLQNPNIKIIRAKKITIDSAKEMDVQSDGENYVSNHVDVEILEKYLLLKISN